MGPLKCTYLSTWHPVHLTDNQKFMSLLQQIVDTKQNAMENL